MTAVRYSLSSFRAAASGFHRENGSVAVSEKAIPEAPVKARRIAISNADIFLTNHPSISFNRVLKHRTDWEKAYQLPSDPEKYTIFTWEKVEYFPFFLKKWRSRIKTVSCRETPSWFTFGGNTGVPLIDNWVKTSLQYVIHVDARFSLLSVERHDGGG